MELQKLSHTELKPFELMQKAAIFFERLGILYRIVGSMASMAYSEPRFTNDIDILVDLREEHLEEIIQEFPAPDFYLSENAIREAIQNRHQFNIIHFPSGLKLDIIQRKNTEFGELDITLGQRLTSVGHYDAWFASPENLILVKLQYFQEGGSEKHLRDVASLLLVQGENIDRGYIMEWSKKIGVGEEWKLILNRIGENNRGILY